MSSLIDRIAYAISEKSRTQKFRQFLSLIDPKPEDSLVDVGVNTEEYSASDNYLEKHYAYPEMITAVHLEDDGGLFAKRYPKIHTVVADGRQLPFPDNTFTIGYSNAVIEHVGEQSDQKAFLQELFRVSQRGYITTPNRFFPIELHTRIPLLHILFSKTLFDRLLTSIGKSWATGKYMRLLSEQELYTLLIQAGITDFTLTKNRFLGWPMTFTVTWKKSI